MKKLLIILLSALSLTAFAQQKKVAVYVTGEQSGISKVLGDQLVAAFAKSGNYSAMERTDSFLAEINKEHSYERSGAVNDNQIADLGVQFGVDYVCVADITDAFGEKYISARLIDVETAEVVNTHNVSGEMNSMSTCVRMASEIANHLTMGTLQLAEGKYEGDIQDGQPHGNGKIFYNVDNEKDRVSYEGTFENGLPSGQGTMIWKDGQKYIGGWLKGMRSGWGTEYFPNGVKVEGTSVNGKWNGKVTIYDINGDRYEMMAKNDDILNGKGTLYFSDGRKYVGNFVNGVRKGYGVLYSPDGDRYEGNFENGMFHGKGNLYCSINGAKCKVVGTWINDKLSGFTEIYNENNGSEEYGHCVNGLPEGEWTLKTSSGKYLKGYYSNGVQTTKYH